MIEFADVLDSAEPAESYIGMSRRQKNQLSELKMEDVRMPVATSLVYPQYLNWECRGSVIHGMFTGTQSQKHLFTREPTWLKEDRDENKLSDGLAKHKELQERLKQGSVDVAADDDDSYWDSLLEAHNTGFANDDANP